MNKSNFTYSAKPKDIKRQWHVVDATDLVLGRMSSIVANILRGKNKPLFTPHIDCGDYVIIVNASKISLKGNKEKKKIYYWHTGYPGGIKSATFDDLKRKAKFSTIIRKSISGMISRGPLGRDVLKKLYIYSEEDHPHQGQQPKTLDIKNMNVKNFVSNEN